MLSFPSLPSLRAVVAPGLCLSLLLHALPASAQVVQTSAGAVEFIGLEDWSVQMLMDSLGASLPGGDAVALTDALRRLGFPRVAVDRLVPASGLSDPAAPGYVILVTLVEPTHAGDLTLGGPFSGSSALPESWAIADSMFRQYNPAFLGAVSMRWLGQAEAVLPRPPTLNSPEDRARAERVLEVLDGLTSPEDLAAGLRLLAVDRDPGKRALAAAIVGGFPGEESAWRALAEALLDPDPSVNAFASQALGSMVADEPRPLDWAPAQQALRSLLAGSNLAAFPLVLQVLTSTEVSPDLAPALLRDNAHLVLGHLGSLSSPARDTAHRFLVQARGVDLGSDVEPWRDWIDEL